MLICIENSQGKQQYEALGFHIVVDMYDIDDKIDAIDAIETSVKVGRLTKISSYYHFYDNIFSGVVLLAESHLSLHINYHLKRAYLDVYTCGEPQGAVDSADFLLKALKPKKIYTKSPTKRAYENC
ncbi:MAG: S-adenosylmethionine decarboxylase family protein [bacterium]